MSLDLTRNQKARLAAGEAIPLVGKGECPAKKGDVVNLGSGASLKVVRVDPHRGGWRLLYELTVQEEVRLLRRTPPVVVPRRDSRSPTPETIRKAAQESAYTERLTNLVDDAGQAVDEKTQDRFSRESHQDRVRRIADYEKRIRERPLHEQLEDALDEARRSGVDTARYEARIRGGIEALRRRTKRDAA